MVSRLFKILLFMWLPIVSNGQSFHPLISNYQVEEEAAAFVFTIDTDLGTGDFFKIPTNPSGTYNCTVDWGDEATSEITSWDDPDTTHYYSAGGEYTISITGLFTHMFFNNTGDKLKLTGISSFGEVGINNVDSAFWGCSNATGAIPAFPATLTTIGFRSFYGSGFTSVDLTGIINIQFAAFRGCSFTSDLIIPYPVGIIQIQSFYDCTMNNNDVHVYAHVSTLSQNSFTTMNNIGNLYLHYTSLSSISLGTFTNSTISGDVYIYAPTAPSITSTSFNFTTTPVLHVPSGATGYDSGYWLTDFSSVVYDL